LDHSVGPISGLKLLRQIAIGLGENEDEADDGCRQTTGFRLMRRSILPPWGGKSGGRPGAPIRIVKGLDIPIAGAPEQIIGDPSRSLATVRRSIRSALSATTTPGSGL
jgi:hypothetical protein